MGNSGFRKLLFQGPIVESPYNSLYDMTVININKQEEELSKYNGQVTIVVNSSSNNQIDQDNLKKIQNLASQIQQKNINILIFPSNSLRNEQHNYQEINDLYTQYFETQQNIKVMQKIEINGHYQHPIYKFLKRNYKQLYNGELCQGKNIPEDFCMFLVNRNGIPVHFYLRNTEIDKILTDSLSL